jgi:hypothetical protein
MHTCACCLRACVLRRHPGLGLTAASLTSLLLLQRLLWEIKHATLSDAAAASARRRVWCHPAWAAFSGAAIPARS